MAGTLFLASIPFAWSFFGNYAEQRAYFDEESVKFHHAQAAGDDVLHTHDVLQTAFASVRAVVANYQQIFSGKSVGDTLDRALLEEGQALIRTAEDRIGVAEAAIASAAFTDAALNAATAAMRADMQAQEKKMKIFVALYSAALRSDAAAISAAVKQVRADNDQTNAVKEALFDRWDHFSRAATRFHEETEIEVQKATRQIQWFYIHKTLAWASVLYVTGFLIVGFRALRKNR